MIFGLFTLAVALTISAVAAYYSIAGLCAIFAAAVMPVVIMGASLEAGKIVATVWLHKFWHRANIQFKLYLIPAIVILMLVTSMGIFGFLSKAHMDQSVTVDDSAAQVQILDEKIKTEQDNIAANRKALQQMDAQVDQLLGRTTDDKGANRAVQVRKQQAKERKVLQEDIASAQKRIATLQNERAPLAAQTRKIEAEVGPIKYIAALIYGDNPDANLLERAVRWVIILLVFVFDPLALVLILAAEQTIAWARQDRATKRAEEEAKAGWHKEWVPDTERLPPYELDDGPLTEEQIVQVQTQANVDITDVETVSTLFEPEDSDEDLDEFFAHGKELAQAIDDNDGALPPKVLDELDIPVLENEETWASRVIDEQEIASKLAQTEQDLATSILLVQELQEKNAELEKYVEEHRAEIESHKAELEQIKSVDPINITDHLGNQIAVYYPPASSQVTIPDMAITTEDNNPPSKAGFGIVFPDHPEKGDLYLRVDLMPSRLYKWNGTKWIEVDKTVTDIYSFDDAYIEHLVEKLRSGEYEYDLLTTAEQLQVTRYIDEQSKKQ